MPPPQGLLALVWLRSWSLVVVTRTWWVLKGGSEPVSAFLADYSPTPSQPPAALHL